MNLSFFKKQSSNIKHYLGLFLKSSDGAAMVIQKTRSDDFSIEESEKFNYSNGWENITEDLDDALFKLENKTNLRMSETIVFVYSHLIDQKSGQIKSPYISKIKYLFKNLELKPIGYIECYEAVAKYLSEKDQMPLSAILVELDKTDMSVFVYKGGKVMLQSSVSSTSNIVDDLKICLNKISNVLLPTRIILYNSKDLDGESSKILTHHWSQNLFVQPPRVEIVTEEEVVAGLVKIFKEQLLAGKTAEKLPDEVAVTNQKVAGFMIGEDIGEVKNKPQNQFQIVPKSPTSITSSILMRKIWMRIHNQTPVLAIAGIIIIFFAVFLNEYFFHKARLTVFLPSQLLQQSIDYSTDLTNGSKDNLQIHVATSSSQYSDSAATTGQREVGEEAKGSVTIYNYDDKEKTIAKGTIFKADAASFVLQDEVKVASSSENTPGVKQSGKAGGNLVAVDIGSSGNISKGRKFQIADLSITLFYAINDNEFSGGSKKEVKTVAKKDLEQLQSHLTDKAIKQKEITDTALATGDRLLTGLTQVKLEDAKYSKELAEEADSLTLTAKTKVTYYFYKEDEMRQYISGILQKNLMQGYKLENDFLGYKIEKIDMKKDRISFLINAKAKGVRAVSKNNIVHSIVAKDDRSVEGILKNNLKVQGYELKIDEPIPFLKHTLPFFEENILVIISVL